MSDDAESAPIDPRTEARIRDSFARQDMMTTIGASIETIGAGAVTLSAELGDDFRQQQGFAHGAFVFALGDVAAGYSALSVMPDDVEVMTAEMKISLLAPGKGRLVAEGRVVKSGRRLLVVAADVWADGAGDERRHVATMLGTMIAVRPS